MAGRLEAPELLCVDVEQLARARPLIADHRLLGRPRPARPAAPAQRRVHGRVRAPDDAGDQPRPQLEGVLAHLADAVMLVVAERCRRELAIQRPAPRHALRVAGPRSTLDLPADGRRRTPRLTCSTIRRRAPGPSRQLNRHPGPPRGRGPRRPAASGGAPDVFSQPFTTSLSRSARPGEMPAGRPPRALATPRCSELSSSRNDGAVVINTAGD
jgi:hypothetical protein